MIFNRHLFKESIRQSRVLGVVFILMSVFFAGISVVIQFFDHRGSDFKTLITASNYSGALFVTSLVFPIFFVIKLFSFLFRRGSSDFYHALPFTRQCLYFTNLVVCLMWYVIGLITAILFNTLFYVIDKTAIFKTGFIFTNFIVYFLVMLQVTGAMLIAVSTMGKKGASLFTGLLVLYLPRIVFQLLLLTIEEITGIIDYNNVFWLSQKYSLAYAAPMGKMLMSGDFNNSFVYIPGMVCSLIIAVLYIAAGLWLFMTRKSEVAENASPSKKVETVLQISYSLVFFLLAVSLIFIDDEWTFIIPAGIGFVIFVCYELWVTRSLKKLFKSLPRFLIVIALSGLYFLIIALSRHLLITKVPSSEEIKYVKQVQYTSYFDYYDSNSYNTILAEDLCFDSQEIRNVIAAAYAETCENLKKRDSDDYYHDSRSSMAVYGIKYKNSGYHVRKLWFTEEQDSKLTELMMSDPEYLKAKTKIPEKDYYVTSFRQSEHNKEIWECFSKEFEKLSDQEKLVVVGEYTTARTYLQSDDETSYIEIMGYYGSQTYRNNYVIIKSMLPETFNLFKEFERVENYENMKEALSAMRNAPDYEGSADLRLSEIRTEDITINYFTVYISFDKGRITSVNMNGSYYFNKDLEPLDEQMEEDKLDYDEDAYNYYKTLNFNYYSYGDDSRGAIGDLLACLNIDEEPGTAGGVSALADTAVEDYSLRGGRLRAEMKINVYPDKLKSLIEKYNESY